MKFQLALEVATDPVTAAGALVSASKQAGDTPTYGQGWGAYGERVGATAADNCGVLSAKVTPSPGLASRKRSSVTPASILWVAYGLRCPDDSAVQKTTSAGTLSTTPNGTPWSPPDEFAFAVLAGDPEHSGRNLLRFCIVFALCRHALPDHRRIHHVGPRRICDPGATCATPLHL
jgi:hypothetical protein